MPLDPTPNTAAQRTEPAPAAGAPSQRARAHALVLLGVLSALLAAGLVLRQSLGVDFTIEGLRGLVAGLGWKAPVLFVGLVTFRQFLLLPSAVVLSVGGLCFGAVAGTWLGALGVALSALMKFVLARRLLRKWLREQMQVTLRRVDRFAASAGPLTVGLTTALPMGPMAPMHWAAGFSTVPWPAFVLAVGLGSPVRAFLYSFFGASLEDLGSPRFLISAGLILALGLAPLAHPGVRRRILAGLKRPPGVA